MASADADIRIVIAERGWVFVGRYAEVVFSGELRKVCLTRGYIVRRWGTTKGLGELAIDGPRPETVLDRAPEVELPIGSVLATLRCDAGRWSSVCREAGEDASPTILDGYGRRDGGGYGDGDGAGDGDGTGSGYVGGYGVRSGDGYGHGGGDKDGDGRGAGERYGGRDGDGEGGGQAFGYGPV